MNEIEQNHQMLKIRSNSMTGIVSSYSAAYSKKLSTVELIDEFLPLPPTSIFIGIADDGLPVLLNISNSSPGPILVLGDSGSGKSHLIKVIAESAAQLHKPDDLLFAVISSRPDEWNRLKDSPNCIGILQTRQSKAEDLLHSLSNWAHSKRSGSQSIMLLVDDFCALLDMQIEAAQNLRWLLLRGPSRRIWPIVTVNPKSISGIYPWMSFFYTRLFGRIENAGNLKELAGGLFPPFEELEAGNEFMLREGNNWLKFWIPSII